MARNYRELRQKAGGNIVYNPVEAAEERRSSSGGRDYRQAMADLQARREEQHKLYSTTMATPGGMNLHQSVQNFERTHPTPRPAQKSKGVAVAMADTLGGVLDGITFGATKPLTDRFHDYIGGENEATAVSPQRRAEIEAKNGDAIGEFVGAIGSGAGAYRAAAKLAAPLTRALPGVVERGVAPLASRLSPTTGAATRVGAQKVGQGLGMAATGAAAGALWQAPKEVTEELYGVNNQTLGERARDIGLSAAFGAVLDPAAEIFGGAIGSALRSRLQRNNIPEEQVQEILALPMGRADAARMRSQQTPGTEPIINEYTFGLPSPQVGAPTRARVGQQANPYREQFENLMKEAQRMQSEGRFTPGREELELESLWSQMAGRDAPSLDELISLAYKPRTSRVEPGMAARAREYQQSRQAAGVPMPVREMADRYQSGVIAEAAAPQTVAKRVGEQDVPIAASSRTKAAPVVEAEFEPIREAAPQPQRQYRRPGAVEETPVATTAADDVADDIDLPEPDEVAPRVRDRVNTYADDLINSAREELARSRNRLSSNPVDVYAQYAKIGAGYMLKGSVKLADFTEALVRDFGENIRPHARAIFKPAKKQYAQIKKQIEAEELGLTFDATKLKDLSNLNLNTADVYRNFRKVFGANYGSVKKAVLDPFDEAKGAYAQEQKSMADTLYRDVVQGLGIRKGSKESELVQKFGEKQITLEQLKQQAPRSWQKIAQADQWFREQYDDLIDRVNESVARIYPNKPEKLVPKRDDYYRHFQEMNAWSGLKNLFDTTSARISPSLAGLSPHTQPKTKWASFKQKRGLGEFKNDAVGGFLDYIPAASYAIHIDPHIAVFRNLAKRLAEDTEKTANVNNFIKFLNNFANDLSGKTSPIDRWVEEIGGRKALMTITKLNNRVKSNTILGNAGSVVAQIANIPNGLAYAGIDAIPGLGRTAASLFSPNEAMSKSVFMRERYLDKSFRKFEQRWWAQPKRFAEATMEIADRIGTSITWNSAYAKGVRQKVADPVRFADEQTRRLVGGRGVGEQPLLIKSKVFNILAPFQLEVNNQWRVMKDFVDDKAFGGLASLLIFNWAFNKLAETVRGSSVTFDPIDAIYEAVSEDDINILQRTGRVAGEMLSNLPLGQNLAAMYPEYGTNLYGMQLPTREGLFGEKDPTRFGEGLVLTKGIQDPLFKLVLPWGGNQLKKSTQGIDALVRDGSYTDTILTTGVKMEDPSLRFPVNASNPFDAARSVLFGPYATSQGKEYTSQERRPLTPKQTQQFQTSNSPQKFYDDLMAKRRVDTEKAKAKKDAAKQGK